MESIRSAYVNGIEAGDSDLQFSTLPSFTVDGVDKNIKITTLPSIHKIETDKTLNESDFSDVSEEDKNP